MKINVNDGFALRGGERVTLRELCEQDRYAVMVAPVPPLPEPRCEVSAGGAPVEQFCVVAAEFNNGRWQWMHLLPDAKGVVGDILFDYGFERGKWWGMVVIPPLERVAQDGGK